MEDFSWKRITLALIGIVVVAALICGIAFGAEKGLLAIAGITGIIFLFILGVYALGWVAILIHELGHCVAALLCGFRICAVLVQGTAVYWNRNYSKGGCKFSSYVYALKENPTKSQLTWFTLGGPISTIIALVVSYWSYVEMPTSGEFLVKSMIFLFCIINLVLTVSFGFSFKASGGDGDILHAIWTDPEKVIRTMHQWAVYENNVNLRPRAYSDEFINTFFTEPVTHAIYHFWKAMDGDNIDLAWTHIQAAYLHGKADPELEDSGAVFYEMAMYAARFRQDQQLSDEAFSLATASFHEHRNRIGAEMARAYAFGGKADAVSMAKRAVIEAQEKESSPAMVAHATEWYERIVPEARS